MVHCGQRGLDSPGPVEDVECAAGRDDDEDEDGEHQLRSRTKRNDDGFIRYWSSSSVSSSWHPHVHAITPPPPEKVALTEPCGLGLRSVWRLGRAFSLWREGRVME